jgi:hypothetical protein
MKGLNLIFMSLQQTVAAAPLSVVMSPPDLPQILDGAGLVPAAADLAPGTVTQSKPTDLRPLLP